jgi:hypothetical protein
LAGSSPLTCLAWEALPVAYAIASIDLGIMWLHKPHHYVNIRDTFGGRGVEFPTLWINSFREKKCGALLSEQPSYFRPCSYVMLHYSLKYECI